MPAATTKLSSYPSNGQIHSQYHGYYVKADVNSPPPEEPIGYDDDLHPSSLARLPPPAKPIRESSPAPKYTTPSPAPLKEDTKAPEPPKPKKQESVKAKSLAETKKQASMEIAPEIVQEESVSSIKSVL